MILCQTINLCFVIPSPSSNFETHRHICSFFTIKKTLSVQFAFPHDLMKHIIPKYHFCYFCF